MELAELQKLQYDILKLKGWIPKNTTEAVLHLVEEVGEVCEAIRENQSREELELEISDVFWQLNKLCLVEKINLEKVFLKTLNIIKNSP